MPPYERQAEITYQDESQTSGMISLGSDGVNLIEVHFEPENDISEVASRCAMAVRSWCEGEVKVCRGSFSVMSNPTIKKVGFSCNSVGCPFINEV